MLFCRRCCICIARRFCYVSAILRCRGVTRILFWGYKFLSRSREGTPSNFVVKFIMLIIKTFSYISITFGDLSFTTYLVLKKREILLKTTKKLKDGLLGVYTPIYPRRYSPSDPLMWGLHVYIFHFILFIY